MSASIERLEVAKAEAQRFIKRADAAIAALTAAEDNWGPCPAHAAAKRASMDLTKSLADVRRPSP